MKDSQASSNAKPKFRNEKRSFKQCVIVLWNLTNQRDNEQNLRSLKTMRINHIAGKGFASMTHYNLVHKFIPMPQAMKIREAKAAVDKEEARNNPSMATGESQEHQGGYSSSTKRHKESPLYYIDGHMPLQKNAELKPKLQKYKGRSRVPGRHCKKDSASQMTAAKIMDVIARTDKQLMQCLLVLW